MRQPQKVSRKALMLVFLFATLVLITLGLVLLHLEMLGPAGVFFGVGIVTGIVFLRFFWEYLSTKKFMQGFFRSVSKLFSIVARRLSVLAKKASIQNPLRLTIFKDEKTALRRSAEKKRTSPYKRMKWKHLTNDTDRVRFVYYFFMRKKIRKGFRYNPSQTPSEVCHEMRQKNATLAESELFDIYNAHRYDRMKGISSKTDNLQSFIK